MYATLIKGLDILFIFLSRAELYKLLLFGGKKKVQLTKQKQEVVVERKARIIIGNSIPADPRVLLFLKICEEGRRLVGES